MKIGFDFNTIKAGKRYDATNPITKAMLTLFETCQSTKHEVTRAEDADVVFVFGSITIRKPNTERAIRIQKWRDQGKHILSLDSGLFGTYMRASNQTNESNYFRIGYGDCVGTGDFFNEGSEKNRYISIKNSFSFEEANEKVDGDAPILFLGQSEKGWQYNNKEDYWSWARKVVGVIRSKTSRRIIFRTHPNTDRHPVEWITSGFENIEVVNSDRSRRSAINDIRRAGMVVTHSSSAAVESIVEGIPTIVLDPRGMGYDFCWNDLENINHPEKFDWSKRPQQLNDWAFTSWSLKEMENKRTLMRYLDRIEEFQNEEN